MIFKRAAWSPRRRVLRLSYNVSDDTFVESTSTFVFESRETFFCSEWTFLLSSPITLFAIGMFCCELGPWWLQTPKTRFLSTISNGKLVSTWMSLPGPPYRLTAGYFCGFCGPFQKNFEHHNRNEQSADRADGHAGDWPSSLRWVSFPDESIAH